LQAIEPEREVIVLGAVAHAATKALRGAIASAPSRVLRTKGIPIRWHLA
jgi:hypothetical protein